MKPQSLVSPLIKFAATALVAAAIGTLAHAEASVVIASDNASSTNYPGGNWTTGSNGGTGFGNWTITSNSGGNFIGPASAQGSNSATIDTSGNSFGLWADAGGFVTASRSFALPGDEFSIELAYKWDNGDRGVNIRAGEIQVFNFNINGGGFSWTGNGSAAPADWPGNRENGAVIRITFTKTSTGFNYSFSSNQATSLNGQTGSITSATPDEFQIYVSNAGGGNADSDFFFNSLQLLGTPTPPPTPTITSPWSAVAVPGVAFSYQTTVTPADLPTTYNATGLPSGLSIDTTTGLISGTVSATGYVSSNISASNISGTTVKNIFFYIGKAADTALNYIGGNWTDGSNLSIGSGFGSWSFISSNGSGAAGTFLGNPADAGILEMPTVSFGLYANPGDSGAFIDTRRNLSSPLAVGEALAFDWGMNFDSNTTNGSKGFVVFVGNDEAVNIFNGNSGNITVNGVDTGFAYGTYAMFWQFFQSANNSISVYGEPRNWDPSQQVFTANITTNGTITAVKFYANGLDADIDKDKRQPYFNNLVIMPASGPSPSPYNAWASSYSLDPGVTTGPSAGAPEADPDSDSFTNQQEYAYGTDPVQATAGLMTTTSTGGNLTVTFLTRTELSYMVQTTDNLATTPFADNPGVTIVDGPTLPAPPTGYIRKQFTITPTGSKNFYRVIASEQNPG
jgi:hypothetical protein